MALAIAFREIAHGFVTVTLAISISNGGTSLAFAGMAVLAAANWLYHGGGKVSSRVEAGDEAKPLVFVD
ncbi:hypothetical protein FBY33_2092 [Arthrobacter sp. SLBN-112]|nr:hypothetical protein FBY33_2092 [Arthrobacter sp. SLBN-112]